ncbi:hypothetical protein ABPG77_006392 [Micractinium sp. CCAP 211/92]
MILRLLCTLAVLLAGGAAAQATAEAVADLVDFLPNFGKDGSLENGTKPLTVYSGYLQVNKEPSREIFYSFVESEDNPDQDPLLVWLQGGPGCSSVGIGLFQEIGPFSFDYRRNISKPALGRNSFSWHKFANVLFLDTPAFTGFSRSTDNVSGQYWGDDNTTADNLLALRAFYSRFPEMAGRPLFLAGQGYAGHFIPLLAKRMLDYNAQGLPDPYQLKGILLGNPWTDPTLDNAGAVGFWYSQGIISRPTFDALKSSCDPSKTVLWMTQGNGGNVTGACKQARDTALKETAQLNMFGLGAPRCVMPPNFTLPGDRGVLPLEGDIASVDPTTLPKAFQSIAANRPGGAPNPYFDPCLSYRAAVYLSEAEVQQALHAIGPDEAAKPWQACNPDVVRYSLPDMLTSMLPTYTTLINSSLPILVYSGVADATVPTVGTRTWVESLRLQPAAAWAPLMDQANEVMGFAQEYQGGLTFATLLDAGHSVPWFKPARAQYFVGSWVGKLANSTVAPATPATPPPAAAATPAGAPAASPPPAKGAANPGKAPAPGAAAVASPPPARRAAKAGKAAAPPPKGKAPVKA